MHAWRNNPAVGLGFSCVGWPANMALGFAFLFFSTTRLLALPRAVDSHAKPHTESITEGSPLTHNHRALGKATTGLMLLHIAVRETMIYH
jgi:hypothetical protein